MATVVGAHCFGAVPDALKGRARRLADLANVRLLAVYFSGTGDDAAFVGADPWPDISSPELGAAVIALLRQGGGR